jgi:hypothetical protein
LLDAEAADLASAALLLDRTFSSFGWHALIDLNGRGHAGCKAGSPRRIGARFVSSK